MLVSTIKNTLPGLSTEAHSIWAMRRANSVILYRINTEDEWVGARSFSDGRTLP
jgi:hypothetical protein